MAFEFPTNVKQIGTITDGLKIYMEDYVNTYLHQISEDAEYEDQLAFLIGRNMVIDGQDVLFISGAIKAKECILENNILKFTRKTWELLKEDNEKYFEKLEVVGWMESQAGYGASLSASYEEYHKHKFREYYQVMLVIDTLEKVECFYTWNTAMTGLKETKGYFIYYDKNRNMHEYMLSNKSISIKQVIELNPDRIDEDASKNKEFPENTDNQKTIIHNIRDRPEHKITRNNDIDCITEKISSNKKKENSSESFKNTYQRQNRNSVENWRVQTRASAGSRNNNSASSKQDVNLDNKRLLNMLVSLSGVLFVVCLVMGTGLLQNEDRIASMESELNEVHNAYKNLLVTNKNTNDTTDNTYENAYSETQNNSVVYDESASVFASQTNTIENSSQIEFDISEEFTSSNLEITNQIEDNVEVVLSDNLDNDLNNDLSEIQSNEEIFDFEISENETEIQNDYEVLSSEVSENETEIQNDYEVLSSEVSENETEIQNDYEALNSEIYENETFSEALENVINEDITKEEEDNASYRTYTVQDGDSLARISLNYYGTTAMMEVIMETNGIDDPDKIFVGKELLIP